MAKTNAHSLRSTTRAAPVAFGSENRLYNTRVIFSYKLKSRLHTIVSTKRLKTQYPSTLSVKTYSLICIMNIQNHLHFRPKLHSLLILIFIAVIISSTAFATKPYSSSPFGSVLDRISKNTSKKGETSKNNQVLILDNGYNALLARVHLIRNASHSINIQTFIWTNDECGRLLMYELIQAAKRGVKVRIIADHFISNKDPKIMAFLATVHPNIKLKHYRPVADRINPSKTRVLMKTIFRFRGMNQRMHNKIMTFDNVIAITGGRNIENSYFNYSLGMNFRDRDILVLGPVVSNMKKSFDKFWDYKHSVPSDSLIDVKEIISKKQVPEINCKDDFELGNIFNSLVREAGNANAIKAIFIDQVMPAKKVTFLSDKPGKNRSGWLHGQGKLTKQIGKIVSKSKNELIIQSPYFVLSKDAVELFANIRKKKPAVNIRVSSNSFGSTDNTVAYSANYRLRSTTIEKLGMFVYEFKPHPGNLLELFPQYPEMLRSAQANIKLMPETSLPFLCIHAKSFVMDDKTAYIGSYNLDPRSENLNTEVGLLIEDQHIASILKALIMRDCEPANSWVIAKVEMPLQLEKANWILQGISGLSPIDLWPIRNTSSFELIEGKTALRPDHADFYKNYRNIGCFPGAHEALSKKEISTRIYKAIGGLATPIL